MLHGREKIILCTASLNLCHDGVHDLGGILHILDFSLNTIFHATIFSLKEVLVVDGFIFPISINLLVDDLILKAFHFRENSFDAT